MVRLRTNIINLNCSAKGRTYFSSGLRPILLVNLESSHDLTQAEYAPLANFHSHSVFEAQRMLEALDNRVLEELLALEPSQDWDKLAYKFEQLGYPVSYILSCLFYRLHINKLSTQGSIKLSGLVINFSDAYKYLNKNYSCIKIKIGSNISEYINNLKSFQSQESNTIKIRFDANKCLDLARAKKFLQAINLENVDYFEEPLNNIEDLPRLYDHTGVNFAIDESFSSQYSWKYLRYLKIKYIIIKPSKLASIYSALSLGRDALRNDIIPILSTCFESSLSSLLFALVAYDLDLLKIAHGIWVDDFYEFNEFCYANFCTAGHIDLQDFQDAHRYKPLT